MESEVVTLLAMHSYVYTHTHTVYRHTPLSLYMYLKFRRSCLTLHNIESRDH